MSAPRKPDPVFEFLGNLFKSARLRGYARASAMDLPPEVRDRLMAYRNFIFMPCAALVLLLVHARVWTLIVVLVVAFAFWQQKSRWDRQLDEALAPYLNKPPV